VGNANDFSGVGEGALFLALTSISWTLMDLVSAFASYALGPFGRWSLCARAERSLQRF